MTQPNAPAHATLPSTVYPPATVVPSLIPADRLPALAFELAQGLESPATVLSRYSLRADDPAVDLLLDSPGFQRLFTEAIEEARKADGSLDRLRSLARQKLMQGMEKLAASFDDARHTLAERVQLFRALAKVAGAEDPPAPPPPIGAGEKFVVNISIPGGSIVSASVDTGASVGAVIDGCVEPDDVDEDPDGQALDTPLASRGAAARAGALADGQAGGGKHDGPRHRAGAGEPGLVRRATGPDGPADDAAPAAHVPADVAPVPRARRGRGAVITDLNQLDAFGEVIL